MDDIPNWLKALSGLLTPLLGIVATAIIVMQYFLQKNRWKLDLFEKRYPIYDNTKKYLASIAREGKITHIELLEFLQQTRDSEFLFGEDVNTFLKLIYKKGVDLEFIGKKVKSVIVEEERLRSIEQEYQLLNWFSSQFTEASKIFGEYLRIDKK